MDKKILLKSAFAFLLLSILPLNICIAEDINTEPKSLEDAFSMGKANLLVRSRYETVHQEGISKDANAFTILSRLGYETAEYQSFKAFMEVENVSAPGNESYNSTTNGSTQYPIVSDPTLTQVNQAFLSYSGLENTSTRFGRRVILLDNQRFVGDVGWRQNNQTFDGIDLENNSWKDTKIFYSWNYQVNRIFGEDSPQGTFNSQIHLLNVNHQITPEMNIAPFIYLLDLENAADKSGATYGGRFTGTIPVENTKLKIPYE
ncbi:MAG: alginate export family protein, partial [Candidatus Paceibacterota bacterium]